MRCYRKERKLKGTRQATPTRLKTVHKKQKGIKVEAKEHTAQKVTTGDDSVGRRAPEREKKKLPPRNIRIYLINIKINTSRINKISKNFININLIISYWVV